MNNKNIPILKSPTMNEDETRHAALITELLEHGDVTTSRLAEITGVSVMNIKIWYARTRLSPLPFPKSPEKPQ